MAAKNLITLCFLLLFTPAIAQELPEAPKPIAKSQHHFFDRQNNIALAASFGTRLADTIQTCHLLREHWFVTAPDGATVVTPYFREQWLPTQSCAGIAGWNSAYFAGSAAAGYWLHKTGHHRLEHLPMWITAGGSAAGILYNLRAGHVGLLPPGVTVTHR